MGKMETDSYALVASVLVLLVQNTKKKVCMLWEGQGIHTVCFDNPYSL